MSEHVSVEVGPGGGPVAVKRAEGDDGRQRLRREAEVLKTVQGPGVVDFVALDDDDTTTSLSTAWLGGGTFAAASFAPKKLASATASLALTVASLHERGFVHRRVTGDHVLLDSAGKSGPHRLRRGHRRVDELRHSPERQRDGRRRARHR